MKISASLFLSDMFPHKRTLYNKIVKSKVFDDHPPRHVFSSLKKAGVDGIELLLPSYLPLMDHDIQEVKEMLDENKTPVFSVHQVIRLFTRTHIAEITRLFVVAQMLGAKVIVLHTSSAGRQVFDSEYVAALHALQKEYGIKVGFENMEKFFGSLHKKHGWHSDKFASLMKKNNFLITFDIQHLAHSGGDIIDFFKKNKEHIINIHLSDYKPHIFNTNLRPLRYKHLPLGKGELPIQDFLQVLEKEQYNGLLTMEINTDLAGLCESARIIHDGIKKKHEDNL